MLLRSSSLIAKKREKNAADYFNISFQNCLKNGEMKMQSFYEYENFKYMLMICSVSEII